MIEEGSSTEQVVPESSLVYRTVTRYCAIITSVIFALGLPLVLL